MKEKIRITRQFLHHLRRALKEFKCGAEIGRRGTPAISFWNAKDKWKNHGRYWESDGRDGDMDIVNGTLVYPETLRLIYIRIPYTNNVCQLAYRPNLML